MRARSFSPKAEILEAQSIGACGVCLRIPTASFKGEILDNFLTKRLLIFDKYSNERGYYMKRMDDQAYSLYFIKKSQSKAKE